MKKTISILLISSSLCGVFAAEKPNLLEFRRILSIKESGNDDFAVGDNGKAISRYQIWRVCYQDAKEFDKSITFSYESLTNKANSDKVIDAYIKRYEPRGGFEEWAKLINGGPNWRNKTGEPKKRLVKYWADFQKIK